MLILPVTAYGLFNALGGVNNLVRWSSCALHIELQFALDLQRVSKKRTFEPSSSSTGSEMSTVCVCKLPHQQSPHSALVAIMIIVTAIVKRSFIAS